MDEIILKFVDFVWDLYLIEYYRKYKFYVRLISFEVVLFVLCFNWFVFYVICYS